MSKESNAEIEATIQRILNNPAAAKSHASGPESIGIFKIHAAAKYLEIPIGSKNKERIVDFIIAKKTGQSPPPKQKKSKKVVDDAEEELKKSKAKKDDKSSDESSSNKRPWDHANTADIQHKKILSRAAISAEYRQILNDLSTIRQAPSFNPLKPSETFAILTTLKAETEKIMRSLDL